MTPEAITALLDRAEALLAQQERDLAGMPRARDIASQALRVSARVQGARGGQGARLAACEMARLHGVDIDQLEAEVLDGLRRLAALYNTLPVELPDHVREALVSLIEAGVEHRAAARALNERFPGRDWHREARRIKRQVMSKSLNDCRCGLGKTCFEPASNAEPNGDREDADQ